MCHVPSEGKATAAERLPTQALNRPDLPESMTVECVPVTEWMEAIISIMLGTGNRAIFAAIHCDVSFVLSKFKERPKKAAKRHWG